MKEISLIAFGFQVPILLLLFFLTREFAKFDLKKFSELIAFGWLINLLIVVLNFIYTSSSLSNNIPLITFEESMQVLDLLMSSTFIITVGLAFRVHQNIQKKIGLKYWLQAIFLTILISGILFIELSFKNVIADVILSLFRSFSLFCIFYYYLKGTPSSGNNLVLILGFIIYLLLQYFVFIDNDYLSLSMKKNIGWISSGIAKILILYWLYRKIISKVHQNLQVEVYQQILGLSLHESTPLLKFAYNDLTKRILPGINKEIKSTEFDRHDATNRLKNIALILQRIKLIQDASSTLFQSAIRVKDIRNLNINDLTKSGNKIAVKNINVNRIIELSFLWRKSKYKKNRYKIRASYGGNCMVRFNEVAFHQIIDNILKNAEEAVDNNPEENFYIYVKTRVVRKEDVHQKHKEIFQNSYENSSFVKIEIEDDGIGTDTSLDQLTELGYSEKGDDRGYGMFLIKDFIDRSGGRMYFESPPKESLISIKKDKKNRGSKIILYLPKA